MNGRPPVAPLVAAQYVAAVLTDPDIDLPPAARLVLHELARHWNRRREIAYPGVTTLTRTTGLSDRGVRNAMAQLAAAGVAVAQHRPGKVSTWTLPIGTDAVLEVELNPGTECRTPLDGVRHSVPRPRHSVPDTPALSADEQYEEQFEEQSASTHPAAFTRCPARTDHRICNDDCTQCHGTGHVAADDDVGWSTAGWDIGAITRYNADVGDRRRAVS